VNKIKATNKTINLFIIIIFLISIIFILSTSKIVKAEDPADEYSPPDSSYEPPSTPTQSEEEAAAADQEKEEQEKIDDYWEKVEEEYEEPEGYVEYAEGPGGDNLLFIDLDPSEQLEDPIWQSTDDDGYTWEYELICSGSSCVEYTSFVSGPEGEPKDPIEYIDEPTPPIEPDSGDGPTSTTPTPTPPTPTPPTPTPPPPSNDCAKWGSLCNEWNSHNCGSLSSPTGNVVSITGYGCNPEPEPAPPPPRPPEPPPTSQPAPQPSQPSTCTCNACDKSGKCSSYTTTKCPCTSRCTSDSDCYISPPQPATHLECSGGCDPRCVEVSGAGPNQCTSDAACKPASQQPSTCTCKACASDGTCTGSYTTSTCPCTNICTSDSNCRPQGTCTCMACDKSGKCSSYTTTKCPCTSRCTSDTQCKPATIADSAWCSSHSSYAKACDLFSQNCVEEPTQITDEQTQDTGGGSGGGGTPSTPSDPCAGVNCGSCAYCSGGSCNNYCHGTDTNCGCTSCTDCNADDKCYNEYYRNYYCSGTSCTYFSKLNTECAGLAADVAAVSNFYNNDIPVVLLDISNPYSLANGELTLSVRDEDNNLVDSCSQTISLSNKLFFGTNVKNIHFYSLDEPVLLTNEEIYECKQSSISSYMHDKCKYHDSTDESFSNDAENNFYSKYSDLKILENTASYLVSSDFVEVELPDCMPVFSNLVPGFYDLTASLEVVP